MYLIKCKLKGMWDQRHIHKLQEESEVLVEREVHDRCKLGKVQKTQKQTEIKVKAWLDETQQPNGGTMGKSRHERDHGKQYITNNKTNKQCGMTAQTHTQSSVKARSNCDNGGKNNASKSVHTHRDRARLKGSNKLIQEVRNLNINDNISELKDMGLRQILRMLKGASKHIDKDLGDSQDEVESQISRRTGKSQSSSRTTVSSGSRTSRASSKVSSFYGESGEDSGDSSNQESIGMSSFNPIRVNRNQKLVSGMYDKVNQDVLRKMKWAHRSLEYNYRAKGVEFGDLTYNQYIAGESKIIALTDDESERNGRLRLMNKIAYAMDDTGDWVNCRNYYAAIVVAIEMGEEEWMSNFRRFESKLPRLIVTSNVITQGRVGGSKKFKVDRRVERVAERKRIPETCFCKDFNRGNCQFEGPHLGKYKDEPMAVTLHHYCAKCLLKNKQKLPHPETSEACLFKRNAEA